MSPTCSARASVGVSSGSSARTSTISTSRSPIPPCTSALRCNDCGRSPIGASLQRDTRIDLPFPTAGTMVQFGLSQSGGILGGSGNFQRLDAEGHFYAPIGSLGNPASSPVKFVLGLSTRSGFVFGNSPFFEQLFTLGGTQFFIPLRGYDEASITPFGYDPNAANNG